jgi:hypothetical protein
MMADELRAELVALFKARAKAVEDHQQTADKIKHLDGAIGFCRSVLAKIDAVAPPTLDGVPVNRVANVLTTMTSAEVNGTTAAV